MITEWLGADPGRCGWSPARDRERPRAWNALLAELGHSPPPHRRREAAGHRAGDPGVRARRRLAGTRDRRVARGQRRRTGAGARRIRRVADGRRTRAASLQHRRLGPAARGRAAVGPASLRPGAVGRRRRARSPTCCRSISSLAPPDEDVLAHLVARGGRIAWGVVQPHRPEHGLHALQRLSARHDDGAWSLLTPACGTGRMSLRREHEIATALWDTAYALRRVNATR